MDHAVAIVELWNRLAWLACGTSWCRILGTSVPNSEAKLLRQRLWAWRVLCNYVLDLEKGKKGGEKTSKSRIQQLQHPCRIVSHATCPVQSYPASSHLPSAAASTSTFISMGCGESFACNLCPRMSKQIRAKQLAQWHWQGCSMVWTIEIVKSGSRSDHIVSADGHWCWMSRGHCCRETCLAVRFWDSGCTMFYHVVPFCTLFRLCIAFWASFEESVFKKMLYNIWFIKNSLFL